MQKAHEKLLTSRNDIYYYSNILKLMLFLFMVEINIIHKYWNIFLFSFGLFSFV